jgi:hypothetical protein
MKHYLIILVSFTLVMTGCNNENKPGVVEQGNPQETELPEGRYVIEDDINKQNNDPNSGSFNDYNNKPKDGPKQDNSSDAAKNLKKRYKNLLVFHAADTMKIKKSYIATLILGKDQVLGELKAELLENTNNPDAKIEQDTVTDFGSKMKARLIDMSGAENKGFFIELIGGEEAATQSITDRRKKVFWQWKLTPQTPGQQELRLSINVIEKNGETVNLPGKNIQVMIYAEGNFFSGFLSFFNDKDNIKWILATLLIPIFVAWLSSRMRSRNFDMQQRARATYIQQDTPIATTDKDKDQSASQKKQAANTDPPGPVSES